MAPVPQWVRALKVPEGSQGTELLKAERSKSNVDVDSLSNYLFTKAGLEKKHAILRILEAEKVFDKSQNYFAGRIDRFETALSADAASRGFDGVVCGHIHHAEMRTVNGILYCNSGDWVESCTALVEHGDGRLELLDWAAMNNLSFFAPPSAAAARAA